MAANDPPLSPDEKALLSMRADEFQVALVQGAGSGDWSPFLEGLTPSIRKALITELSVIELGHRWEKGEQPTPDEYVKRFPELAAEGQAPATLREEYERCLDSAGLSAMATRRSKVLPSPPERVPFSPPTPLPPEEPDEDPEYRATRTVATSGKAPVVSGVQGGEGLLGVVQNSELIRELGRGAFGEVWLARKMPSGIEKAVKILHQPADEEIAQREFRSLELIKNLRHPYLLATEDFWVASNKLYIVTELADSSLRRRLVECKESGHPGIPEDELFVYILEAAEGFDYLHSKMITHRDVKPDNILIVNGHAKVADFGLARQHDSPEVAVMSFAGTPAYMAPEVWGGEGGPPSDLYGFAMSCIELRQGRTPFKLGKVMEVMQAHMSGQFDFADFIGEAERAVYQRALAKDPLDRYPSCLSFAEELAEAVGRNVRRKSGPVPPPRSGFNTAPANATIRGNTIDSLTERPAPPRTRKGLLIGGGIVLLAGIVVGIALSGGGKPDSNNRDLTEAKLPPGTTLHGDKLIALAGGHNLPEWITLDAMPGAKFRLVVPKPIGPSVEPFYMLQSKVWNAFYHNPDKDHPTRPVMNLTATEAMEFARKHGGRLPTPDEWDHAAGLHTSKPEGGPFLPGSALKLGLSEPAPTHASEAPRNKLGLEDFAANGREWTCGILTGEGGAWRAVEAFEPKRLVVLRGRNFTLATALTFEIMTRELKQPQTQFADVPSPYTGFRFVLPLAK